MILPGNTSCQGCPISLAMRCLDEIENPVLVMPAGCSTVVAGLHPNSAMKIPVIHVHFASTNAVACGVKEAYKRTGVKANVIAWMGDGAADIGFATLSASAVRKDDLITIVVDNEAYMNTGTQASLSTFWMPKKSTSPMWKEKRNLALIMIGHRVDYIATATVGHIEDLRRKFRKAGEIDGDAEKKNRISLSDYLRLQGRFEHLSYEGLRAIERVIEKSVRSWRDFLEIKNSERKIL